MRISVIIPTWNRAGCLARAIDSVCSQTLAAHEIIVVDDGSTDNTRELVTGHFSGIRYHYQENCGVSSARNTGLRMATGDWIALLDSDDRWQPAKLQRQSEALRARPGYHVCHTDEVWIRHGRRVNPMRKHAKQGGHIFRHCLPRCVISPSSVLIHREVFARIGAFDETLPACEDYDLWLRLCSVYPVLYLDETLIIKFGGHVDQLSQRYWGMDRFRVQALEKIVRTGALSAADQRAALDMLLRKVAIIERGTVKRGNHTLAHEYRNKRTCYESMRRTAGTGTAAGRLPVATG